MAKTFSLEVVNSNDFQPFESDRRHYSLTTFMNFLRGVLGGQHDGSVTMRARNDSVAASGTITLASCVADTVIEVNGVDFIAVSGTPVIGNNEFDISGNDTADATSLALAINNSTSTGIANVVSASSSNGVVTVTSTRKGSLGNGVTIKSKGVLAKATVTPTSPNANDTVTINGVDFTCKQQRATGTLTASSAAAADTFSIQGYTFTGATGASTAGTLTFSVDTSDTACATDIAKQINSFAGLSGLVTATSSSGVVTVRAVTAGTAGNSIALTGTAVRLAASGSGTLSGGIAVANNEFELKGTDTQIAADLARAINASTTGGVNTFANAVAVVSPTIACSSAVAGDKFTIYVNGSYYTFTGAAGAAALGTLGFSIDTGDNATAASIAAQINGYSALSGVVYATASTSTVTVRAVTTAAAQTLMIKSFATTLTVTSAAKGAVNIRSKLLGTSGNAITIATINGTRLPITSSLTRLGSGSFAENEGAQASGTFTLTSWANGETVEVNGVTITAHTNTQANNQVDISGNDTSDAANLALAINNSTSAALKDVVATSSSNVVTVTARRGGIQGNVITMSSAQGTVVASVARLAGGAAPTTVATSADRLSSGSETLITFSF